MMLSLNCLILGQASKRCFTENIGETYKNDSGVAIKFSKFTVSNFTEKLFRRGEVKDIFRNTGEMNLWKVDDKKVEEEENNLKEFTKSDIIEKLRGKEMVARFPLKRYFDVNQEMDIEGIHIFIVPTSTGPNWNVDSSIYKWIKQFTLNRGRDLLVKTYGKDFKFLQRDDTIDALWNGLTMLDGIAARFKNRNVSDKGLHPIPVLAGGPGVGKSRFLDEVERLLVQYANESDDDEIRDAFTNMTVINTTYGNGCPARDMDVTIGAEASLAICILFEYFKPKHDFGDYDFSHFQSLCNNYSNISYFTLSTAIRVVYADVIIQKNQEIKSNPLLVLVLGIDELNQLHDNNPKAFRTLINGIGGVMCSSPANIYFIPILAGTIEGPLNQYKSGSTQSLLPLPLPKWRL
ncbi:hypothetical protein RhiirA5_424071 [Rhizophagus irregularis]|uniref:Crinkler family protein n=1 Tax=Rhizophagus irregularis TaxID=588596 RepID=A0A2N0P8T3_9GLOM|nr:hypothetical protein RhiirA5_424071 [Rhizophagus irregularis]